MRTLMCFVFVILAAVSLAVSQQPTPNSQEPTPASQEPATNTQEPEVAGTKPALYTLTIQVENVNKDGGNIGVLVFSSTNTKGWAEDRFAALKDIVVPAHPGTVTVTVPDLPAGTYGVAIAHDVNKNHKVDKNFFGSPKEQWGMSNNPHATLKAPPFNKAKFALTSDLEIHVTMQ